MLHETMASQSQSQSQSSMNYEYIVNPNMRDPRTTTLLRCQ